jgi:hypothetical protein
MTVTLKKVQNISQNTTVIYSVANFLVNLTNIKKQ